MVFLVHLHMVFYLFSQPGHDDCPLAAQTAKFKTNAGFGHIAVSKIHSTR